MLKYLNLEILQAEEYKKGTTIITQLKIEKDFSLKSLYDRAEKTIHNRFKDLSNKVYNFIFYINYFDDKNLDEADFETAVNVILTAFFKQITTDKGRPRERRLDVPENLKIEVNCSLGLIKEAINHQTLTDRFQLEIRSGNLRYILVGDPNE